RAPAGRTRLRSLPWSGPRAAARESLVVRVASVSPCGGKYGLGEPSKSCVVTVTGTLAAHVQSGCVQTDLQVSDTTYGFFEPRASPVIKIACGARPHQRRARDRCPGKDAA